MFLDYDDINEKISRNLVFTFYGCPELHNEIESSILDFRDYEYPNRTYLNKISKIDDMPSHKPKETDKGILNIEWIQKTTITRPSVIVLIYDARNKNSDLSWSDFENIICTDIHKIRKSHCYSFMNILIFIMSPNSSFSLDSSIEDKDKLYSIKKQLESKYIYYFTGIESIRLSAKKLQNTLYKLSIGYYKQFKKNLKLKKGSYFTDEYMKLSKVNLQLAIVSFIKNKRLSTKYLEEVMNNLIKMDYRNMNKNEYIEMKSIATYVFRKICKLKPNYEYLINLFQLYITTFVKKEFYSSTPMDEEDPERIIREEDKSQIAEHLWLAYEYEFFGNLLKEKEEKYNEVKIAFHYGFSGYYYLKATFCFNRILKTLKYRDYISYTPNFDIKKLAIKKNIYMGRMPSLYVQLEPLNRKEIKYDEDLYLKLFAIKYGINIDNILYKLTSITGDAQNCYFQVLSKLAKQDKSIIFCSNLAFNNLFIKFIKESSTESKEKLIGIYRLCLLTKDLDKFQSLKLKLLEDFNDVSNQPDNIMSNLIEISSIRALTEKEEQVFNKIIKEEVIQQKYSVLNNVSSNNILAIKLELKNQKPCVLDISEFTISLTTKLKLLKINKIKLFFNKPERNTTKEIDFDLLNNNFYQITHKIFVKENDKNLQITNITIDLSCKNGSLFILDYILPVDSNKVLVIRNSNNNKNAVNFVYKKDETFCFVNQYNVFSLNAEKSFENIKVEEINFDFNILSDGVNQSYINNSNQSIMPEGFSVLKSNVNNSNVFSSTITSKGSTGKPKVVFKSFKTPDTSLRSSSKLPTLMSLNFANDSAAAFPQTNEITEDARESYLTNEASLERPSVGLKKKSLSVDLNNSKISIDQQDDYDEESHKTYFDAPFESKIDESSVVPNQNITSILNKLSNDNDIFASMIELPQNNKMINQQSQEEKQSQSSYSVTDGELSIGDYSFLWMKNNNTFVEGNSSFIKLDDLEQERRNIKFLLKFSKPGKYVMVIRANYRISRDNLENDTLLINYKDEVVFNITEGFKLKQEILPNQYVNQGGKKYFSFNTDIKINFSIENKTNLNVTLYDALLKSSNKKLFLKSNINQVLSKETNLEMLIEDEIIISSIINYNNKDEISEGDILSFIDQKSSHLELEFSGIPGKIKLLWREAELENYIKESLEKCENLEQLMNETTLSMQHIDFKDFGFKLDLAIDRQIIFNQPNKMKAIICNTTSEIRRIHFLIDNSLPWFLIGGATKNKAIITPYQSAEFEFDIIPLSYGYIRLPIFKVTEFGFTYDDKKNLIEAKIFSAYYNPDSIQSVGSYQIN